MRFDINEDDVSSMSDISEDSNNYNDFDLDDICWEKKELDIKIKTLDDNYGIIYNLCGTESYFNFFIKFLSKNFFKKIVTEINRKAFKKLNNKWKPVSLEEFFAYLGCRILMGITELPKRDDYWSEDDKIGIVKKIINTFSRKRFEDIETYLHCVNNEDFKDSTDILYKIRPIIVELQNSCQTLFKPTRTIVIDEGMVPFKGRHKIKQYAKDKPVKWGFKIYKLCTVDGHLFNFEISLGKYDTIRI